MKSCESSKWESNITYKGKYTHTNTHTNKKNPTGNENGLNVTSLVCSQSTALKAAVVVFHNISIDSIVEYSTILVVQYFITWV